MARNSGVRIDFDYLEPTTDGVLNKALNPDYVVKQLASAAGAEVISPDYLKSMKKADFDMDKFITGLDAINMAANDKPGSPRMLLPEDQQALRGIIVEAQSGNPDALDFILGMARQFKQSKKRK